MAATAAAEDGPSDTAPREASANAGAATASTKLRKGAEDLAEVMRRRRDSCKEFESVPSSSTADCRSAPVFAEPAAAAPEGSNAEGEPAAVEADASSDPRSRGGSPSREGSASAAPAQSEEKAAAQPAAVAANPPRKSRHTTDDEFQSWMKQMRGRCQVLESEQVASSVADAHCEGVPSRTSTSEGSREPAEASRVRQPRTNTRELSTWMARMRARCQILESTPGSTTADAKSEAPRYEGAGEEGGLACVAEDDGGGAIPSTAAPSPPSSAHVPEGPQPSPPLAAPTVQPEDPKPVVAAASVEHISVRLRLREGMPLTPPERLQIWPSMLLRDAPTAKGGHGRALPALVHLLGASGGAGAAADEDVLFEATAANGTNSPSSADLCRRLAAAFSDKYVAPLSCQVGEDDHTSAHCAPVYAALAQLLRYHHPSTACAIEAVSVPAGFTFAEVLGVVFGGPAGLVQCLLTPHGGGEAEALLLFCDLVVVEEEDILLLLVAAVLLTEVIPEPGCSFEHLKELIRSKRGVGGLGSRGLEGVCHCVAAARAMLESTPVSLLTTVAGDERARARLRLPMCAVAPDEALHHIYERPSGTWRLVVVDVRMRASERALPVCMRLGQLPHTERRRMLRELPYEESIHLCLLGDGPAMPGDDAFELCRHLVSPNVKRRHVSIVDGGWPAVEELADSLRLHLMPLEREEPPASRSSLKEARAAVAGVAGQVASATESATAAGQKMAQRMMKGVRGSVLSVLGSDPASGAKAEASKPSPMEV